MIVGIGCDIIEISRIEKAMKNPLFAKKCFTDAELDYISEKNIESAAGFFAAKEACSKAFGTGLCGISLKDIEVNHTSEGKPYIKTYNTAIASDCNIHLTLSHCREYAAAFVILEK